VGLAIRHLSGRPCYCSAPIRERPTPLATPGCGDVPLEQTDDLKQRLAESSKIKLNQSLLQGNRYK
jgi:hypothetical protein